MEWGLLELDASLPARQLQEPLAEIILLDGLNPADRARLQARRVELADAPFLAALLEAKDAEADGRLEEAAAALASLLENGLVPGRFVHRVWLWQAELLHQAGRASAAANALQEAARACPSDPDVEAALVEFGRGRGASLVYGEPHLDIVYMGGRLLLLQACLEQEPGLAKGMTMHLLWRFRGGLPPDLKIDTRIQGGDGRLWVRKTVVVDQEESAKFNRGNHPAGSTWNWTIPLPPTANEGRRVEVRLFSAGKLLLSDDGLAAVGLNMEKLPHCGGLAARPASTPSLISCPQQDK